MANDSGREKPTEDPAVPECEQRAGEHRSPSRPVIGDDGFGPLPGAGYRTRLATRGGQLGVLRLDRRVARRGLHTSDGSANARLESAFDNAPVDDDAPRCRYPWHCVAGFAWRAEGRLECVVCRLAGGRGRTDS